MPFTTDYLPVATGGGANVDSQANLAGSSYQLNGFTTGIAQPTQANKLWRQASMMAAAIANLMVQRLSINVPDDGNLANLITFLSNLIRIAANNLSVVVFSATPVFDASVASDFEITLTGNVTSSTLVNLSPGQVITFIIHEDGTGGRTFAAPGNVPMAPINTGISKTNVQAFKVSNNLTLYPFTTMTVT
jgi:hypothetical protein